MAQVQNGRMTHEHDGSIGVFLIGMRFNRLHRIDAWWPVVSAMPPMLRHLATHPETGMLGQHTWFGRTTILLTYWRDPQSLQAFAADTDAPHLEPWRRFMRQVGSSGTVGVWHETYVVPAGHHETIYSNMPVFGLAAATRHVPVGAGSNTARQRLHLDRATPAPSSE